MSVRRPVSVGFVSLGEGGLVQSVVCRVSRRLSMAAAALACLVFALLAGAAQAEPPRLIPYGSFDAVTTLPVGIAVDNSAGSFSGDVYVAGFFNENAPPIDKFTQTGKAVAPSPFGENLMLSLAVDPSTGDLYALSLFGSITVYDPSSGAPVRTFPVTLAGEFFSLLAKPPQIAVDSAGDVFVPNPFENNVLEYPPDGCESAPSPCPAVFTGGSGSDALKRPTGVAIDSTGDLWVADGGDNRIVELDSGGAPVEVNGKPVVIGSPGVVSIVLDGHGEVLAIVKNGEDFCGKIGGESGECSHLVEYSTTGVKLADVGAGSFESGEKAGEAHLQPLVAVDQASGRVYVSDTSGRLVWIFGPPAPPSVVKELAAETSTSEAKLGALVNPGGIPTSYRFEYGTTSAYGSTTPFPEGSAGEGIAARTVWAAASGLAPGTTYHYRIVVSNELGTAYGPDQTFTTLTASQAACPNEEFRSGLSGRLPDCRAYELVTAPTTNSVQAEASEAVAADGEAVAYLVNDPLPGAPSGSYHEYLATRGAGGWSSQGLHPLESYSETTCGSESSELAFSDELSKSVISYGHNGRASEPSGGQLERQSCNAEGLQVVSGEPLGYQNLLLRDNATGTYRLVNAPPPGVTPADAFLISASADLSRVVFSEEAPLAPGAQYGVENLYEWDEGVVRLLTFLPDGTPAQGSLPEPRAGTNSISADGSHIVFVSGGDLYVRVDGERTVQVDQSQGPGASGGGSFQAASADGSEVFFTDASKLTANSTAEAGEPDLYECALPNGARACVLSDLTVVGGGEHADVVHAAPLGVGDSSRLYFFAKGVLASNARQFTDSEGNAVTEKAQAGQLNLYLWSGGKTTFVASPSEGEFGEGQASPDGSWFAFVSQKSLTGYDNQPAGEGQPVQETFLYSAASNQLACASCDPSGEQPAIDGGASLNLGGSSALRYISDGGRLLFQTHEALVPSDTNGQLDVYEYEDGRVYLISPGSSPQESRLAGVSEDGGNVFFESTQSLVPQDTQEGLKAIYDARVHGGFPAVASPPACTTADACRAPVLPQPAIYGSPSSQTFSGVGNLTPSSEAKVKKRAKPKPKPKSKSRQCKRLRNNRKKHSACVAKQRKRKPHNSKATSHKGGK